ncbi:kinase-like protein [Saccharata proteae CBS 121410]|uniref:cyclin-dependent kinase n=1 Tax=Saccharata proteae CBS 121410 TaxID=1314787 RepID=A0A9P4LXU3_9PEZI|nr:kinase-like protein [Saccharata proteae CBS 121410]
MAEQTAWQSSPSFSDRLAAIVKITSSYKIAHPETAHADASREAQALEQLQLNGASSLGDYEKRCDAIAQDLLPKSSPEDGSDDAIEVWEPPPMNAIDIGKYKQAVYYRSGLFSEVYKAPRPGTEHAPCKRKHRSLVALKVTVPDVMTAPHDSQREARFLRRANSEEHRIITLLETFSLAGGRYILVFEFMPYGLDGMIDGKALNTTQAKSCLRDLFTAIAYLHSIGIIHRDIKPSNVLLRSPSGPAFLSDFGIAWSADDPASEPASEKITDVGTTHYRPPELLFGNKSYTQSLDLWAAGCVVAEVVGLQGATLFDSGELGSELALIQSIFKSLGTPDLTVWPEAEKFPDWGKMQFYEYPAKPWTELLPHANEEARDLVSGLVNYESGWRLTAAEALKHPYFKDVEVSSSADCDMVGAVYSPDG